MNEESVIERWARELCATCVALLIMGISGLLSGVLQRDSSHFVLGLFVSAFAFYAYHRACNVEWYCQHSTALPPREEPQ